MKDIKVIRKQKRKLGSRHHPLRIIACELVLVSQFRHYPNEKASTVEQRDDRKHTNPCHKRNKGHAPYIIIGVHQFPSLEESEK